MSADLTYYRWSESEAWPELNEGDVVQVYHSDGTPRGSFTVGKRHAPDCSWIVMPAPDEEPCDGSCLIRWEDESHVAFTIEVMPR